ncbi:MAG: asparagine synthetase B, partial [Alphaproteobacteria bacterium]
EHAKAVASHLGTQHTELYVSADDALAVVPKLSAIWDEPFSDSSQIPTYLVSRLTRQSVTVSLSGDGGDELFGGYNRYTTAMRIWDHARHVPRPLRTMLGRVMTTPAAATAARAVAGVLPERVRPLGFVDRLPKVGRLLLEDSAEGMYQRLIAGGGDARELLRGDFDDHALAGWEATDWPDFRQFMMYADTLNYLPDDILVKVDRASMAVSLETRAPFLDYRVAEYAWRLPMSARIRNGVGKHIIREILERYVPRSLTDRPKMGFAMPVSSWLSGALRPWAESLLAADRLDREGLFDPIHVQSLWRDYLAGRTGLQDALWSILMFQAWWEENRPASPRGGLS